MKYLSTLTLLFYLLFSCNPAKKAKVSNAFFEAMDRNYLRVDSLLKEYPDSAVTENEKVYDIIRQHSKQLFLLPDTIYNGDISIVVSADKKLCLVSWNTHLGGTLKWFESMALFYTADGSLQTQMVQDNEHLFGEENSSSLIFYDTLYSFPAGKETLYIAYGTGQGSALLSWQQLSALAIDGQKLLRKKVFPGNKSNWLVEFDISKLKREEIPMIEVMDSGRLVRMPIATDEGGFSFRYDLLEFRDSMFWVKK
ncbi:hypothetical protein SAMN05421788_105114 [Filimonas lacunae]|uniref:Uncharacterized protein n=1 Tax=Filimonas lacunae TaxID=477680 RepID=A0A1N7QEA0_9BACT|nr:hypothetical protein [Filimonas lacunae]SIT21175.1 hypothetical protein SAMN05421788_105114 [Filimonas lacunae]